MRPNHVAQKVNQEEVGEPSVPCKDKARANGACPSPALQRVTTNDMAGNDAGTQLGA